MNEIVLLWIGITVVALTVWKERHMPTLWPTTFLMLGLLTYAAVLNYADRLLTLAGA